jgi:hypothetical protein
MLYRRIHIFQDANGMYGWECVDAANFTVATGNVSYKSKSDLIDYIKELQIAFFHASIVDGPLPPPTANTTRPPGFRDRD